MGDGGAAQRSSGARELVELVGSGGEALTEDGTGDAAKHGSRARYEMGFWLLGGVGR